MDHDTGFPAFRKDALQILGPLVPPAKLFLKIGREVMSVAVSEQLPDLAKQISETVANSMQSVLILACNGCGVDALKIARTMFEAAVTVHYLEKHPELVQDYVDFLWIIRKKHHEYLLRLPSEEVKPVSPDKVREMESAYERVKDRFTNRKGKPRNSWCKASLRDMAVEVEVESMYDGLYPFGSSMTHTDMLAIVAAAGDSGDVEPVPSNANLTLALQTAVVSYAMVLTAFDKIASLGRGDSLEAAFTQFKNASQ